jgi:hypothetical protein
MSSRAPTGMKSHRWSGMGWHAGHHSFSGGAPLRGIVMWLEGGFASCRRCV